MAPSKEALTAAKPIYDRLRGCSTYEGWWCDEETEVPTIAAALDAYAAEQNMVSIAAGQAFAKELQSAEAERDAALARAEAAEAERDNIARDSLRAIVAKQRAEERVRTLESALSEIAQEATTVTETAFSQHVAEVALNAMEAKAVFDLIAKAAPEPAAHEEERG